LNIKIKNKGKYMTVLEAIIACLNDSKTNQYNCTLIDGGMIIEINEKIIPVTLIISDTQITVVCNLFRDNEVITHSRLELLEAMHNMNLPLNLSSFSRSGDWHIIFGALSIDSNMNAIEEEINTLIDNAEDSLLLFEKYLVLE
jgi:uncharacterized protein